MKNKNITVFFYFQELVNVVILLLNLLLTVAVKAEYNSGNEVEVTNSRDGKLCKLILLERT